MLRRQRLSAEEALVGWREGRRASRGVKAAPWWRWREAIIIVQIIAALICSALVARSVEIDTLQQTGLSL